MDRRLGGPLPHQLSNPTRAHPCAINLWCFRDATKTHHAVLAFVSKRYPPHKGRLLTRYSPVRHWSEDRSPRHRSTWMCYARRQRSSWARIKLSDLLYIICFSRTNIVSELFSSFFYFFEFQSILTRFFVWLCQSIINLCCSIFKDRFALPFPQQRSTSIAHTFLFVNTFLKKSLNFFKFFGVFYFLFLPSGEVHLYYHLFSDVK